MRNRFDFYQQSPPHEKNNYFNERPEDINICAVKIQIMQSKGWLLSKNHVKFETPSYMNIERSIAITCQRQTSWILTLFPLLFFPGSLRLSVLPTKKDKTHKRETTMDEVLSSGLRMPLIGLERPRRLCHHTISWPYLGVIDVGVIVALIDCPLHACPCPSTVSLSVFCGWTRVRVIVKMIRFSGTGSFSSHRIIFLVALLFSFLLVVGKTNLTQKRHWYFL